MQGFRVHDQTKKKGFAGNGKNVVKGPTLPVSMMQTRFNDPVGPAVPDNKMGDNLPFSGIKTKVD
jgi:hypothetical protein